MCSPGRGSDTPIYFSGHDRGYEAQAFPGLYDPLTAGDVSPLLNAFEAASAETSPCPAADAFPLAMAPVPAAEDRMLALEDACARTRDPAAVRAALDELSWSLLDATLRAVPRQVLARAARLTAPHRSRLNPAHRRMLAAIEQHARLSETSVV